MAQTSEVKQRRDLLLLPPLSAGTSDTSSATFHPMNIGYQVLTAAYEPALKTALQLSYDTVTRNGGRGRILDVIYGAIWLEEVSFDELQHILARLYKLVSVICAKQNIKTDGEDGLDVRVILNDYLSRPKSSPGSIALIGPIIGLGQIAATWENRDWENVYYMENKAGQEMWESLMRAIKTVGYGGENRAAATKVPAPKIDIKKLLRDEKNDGRHAADVFVHYCVAVGGTFDHLHAGHKLLLTATALLLQLRHANSSSNDEEKHRLIIGITGDALLKNKKYAEFLGSWEGRAGDVIEFLKSTIDFIGAIPKEADKGLTRSKVVTNSNQARTMIQQVGAKFTIECVEIFDPFGPTITDPTITGLVVSGETREGGKAVNDERLKRGMNSLHVFEIDVLDMLEDGPGGPEASKNDSESFSSKISSTEIRKKMSLSIAAKGKSLHHI